MIPIVFIAGPFRGPTAWAVAENVRVAERVALEIAHMGAMPLCPHANTHLFFGQLSEEEFWLPGYQRLLDVSDAMALIPGWEKSMGSVAERARMIATGREERVFDLSLVGGRPDLSAFIHAFKTTPVQAPAPLNRGPEIVPAARSGTERSDVEQEAWTRRF